MAKSPMISTILSHVTASRPAFAGSIFRRYRLIEDSLTDAAVICEPACAALRVAESARERAPFHDAVGGSRREPERQNMVGDVERHLRRKEVENLVDLVRHRNSLHAWEETGEV